MLGNVLKQIAQLYDTMDIVCVAGIVCLVLCGGTRRRGRGASMRLLCVMPGLYIICVGLASLVAGKPLAERYYQPILPFLVVLAGLGYGGLAAAAAHKRFFWTAAAVVFLASAAVAVHEPVRGHRREQTEAGLWLRQHDPHYHGLVLSDYSQPVYYAQMEFLPADEKAYRRTFRQLLGAQKIKYVILDDAEDPELAWLGAYVGTEQWPLVYHGERRDLRIYENPRWK